MSEDRPAGPPLGRPTSSRSRLLVGAASAAGAVLAIVGLGAIILRPVAPATYPAGSPEAAFQAYLTAYDGGDLDAAYAHFSASVRSRLSFSDFRQMVDDYGWQDDQTRRVVLESVDTAADSAVLHLRVEHFTKGQLGRDRTSSYERAIRLVHEFGVWKIDEPLAGAESVGYVDY
jgi:hypothetical protein